MSSGGYVEPDLVVVGAPPAWEELREEIAKLAAENPETCSLRTVGSSRAGEPLELLTFRGGPLSVLVVAGPHPNEPVGGATVLSLARYLLARPETRDGIGWHLMLSSDPDGGRLNEGWSTEWPVSLETYHRHFYRPPVDAQPECCFPVVGFTGQLPETRALMSMVDELRPALSVSLHNSDTGGAFLMASRADGGLVDVLSASADRHGIPLEAIPSDCVGLPSPGAGVFVMPEPLAVADRPTPLPGEWVPAGGSSMHYVARHGGLGISPEVPMWRTAPIKLAAEDGAAYRCEAVRVLTRVLERVPSRPSVFLAAVEEQIAIMRLMTRIARENPRDCADQDLALLVPLRGAGMLLRHLDVLLDETPLHPGLLRERAALEAEFGTWVATAEQALRPVPFTLSRTVGYQVDVVLGAARMVQTAGSPLGR
ncbi:M14 family zinc carboxypeptidase [Streptomyces sp. BB1-1-1]|uniref:M14 family zinc carboxypeptidase n=1 Tax=Streptomyces sp. BB1-1-1 TaxID=3074430 RepID=UPI0028776329|nr:M14 family zinc carboxypeptidase [Streptomyces sp. BB1-1-1]WND36460.1 M14 family zinc carboxypeptidase [Streptomyces sp. BB1-1-1]